MNSGMREVKLPCSCVDVMPASYANQVCLPRPAHMMGRKGEGSQGNTICIDGCLVPEVLFLWEKGIRTTGCCCGHNHAAVYPFIGVVDEDIPKMKAMGYAVQFNHCRPGDEDSFVPMLDMTMTKPTMELVELVAGGNPILPGCCSKREIKVLSENNAVCLSCFRHSFDGNEYTRKEWDALLDTWSRKPYKASCSNCGNWNNGFCESGDSMDEGTHRHHETSATSCCEAHYPLAQEKAHD